MPLFRRSSSEEGRRWLVVGLGNPGARYARPRHNFGAMVLDELLDRTSSKPKSHKSGMLIAEANLAGNPLVLARATSYMNGTGRPLGQLARFYKTPTDQIVVVHDELDIPFGDVRVTIGAGTASHHRVKATG